MKYRIDCNKMEQHNSSFHFQLCSVKQDDALTIDGWLPGCWKVVARVFREGAEVFTEVFWVVARVVAEVLVSSCFGDYGGCRGVTRWSLRWLLGC